MKTRITLLLWAVLALARAASGADLAPLLEYEAEIVPAQPGSGLLRLVLPKEVIARSRADLSDVRIFDTQGNEVPFVVDSGLRAGEVREVTELVEAKVLDVRRSENKPEDQPTIRREEYDIEAPATPKPGTRWELVFDVAREPFIRTVQVASLNGDEETALVPNGTIFRLQRSGVERTSIVLPPFDGARLRIRLEGADGFFLEPKLRLRTTTVFDRGERAVLPLEILSQRTEDGHTSIEVERPDGLVPDVLRLETSTPSYYRVVRTYDLRQGGDAAGTGDGTVFRLDLGQVAEQTEVRLKPARGEKLRIEVDDADSPPLEAVKVFAEVRQPVLYFDLPAGKGTLRFGGGRVERARYDLEQLSPTQSAVRGQVARLGALLLEDSQSRPAILRDVRRNPKYDPAPLLAYAMQPGAQVDEHSFSHRRLVQVAEAGEGLARVQLRPEDLAIARGDLGDLRIVDREGRQRPYLLHRGSRMGSVDVGVGKPKREGGISRYELQLPQTPLPLEGVELDVEQPFFSRSFRLYATGTDGPERVMAQGKLSRGANDNAAVAIALGGEPVQKLVLHVNDGDEAPLPIVGAHARVRIPEVFLIAPKGEYWLLLGDPEAHAPRYDLADVRDAVLAVASVDASAGTLEPNPEQSWRSRWFSGDRKTLQQAVVWAVLGVAVAALALVTIRLVRE